MTDLSSQPGSRAVFPSIQRRALDTLQVNLGYRCNQACNHCHVDAGPLRTEMMSAETIDTVLTFIRKHSIRNLDLTGGAPELNAHFRRLVRAATRAGATVIDRCNLTVLNEPGQQDLAAFLASERVRVVASLPCYSPDNVDAQRGKGVFSASLRGVAALNQVGYGDPDSGLELDFVYNPQGPNLPPDPAALEADYKRELGAQGIVFNRLLTITNVPINRFRHALAREQQLEAYMATLVANFETANLEHVMCRTLLSVDWQGWVYDCDFNQMLAIPAGRKRRHLSELNAGGLAGQPIAVAAHCFACTAGRGSSCGGALTA